MKSALSFFAGIGFYFLAQIVVEWNTQKGETLAAEACVSQQKAGKWTQVKCAGPRK